MDRGEEARRLRGQGLSTSQIASAMGLRSGGGALHRWLKGTEPPEWTRRPNAKDDLRDQAVGLRRQGMSYKAIREQLRVPVSKSTLSLWLRDVALSDDEQALLDRNIAEGVGRRAASIRTTRARQRRNVIEEARCQVTTLAESELFVAGVVAYWSEGAKEKPWRQTGQVTFSNSDPALIQLFLRWLDLIGIDRSRIDVRLYIHERADVAAALAHWSAVVDIPASRFGKTGLKKHNPKTIRKNVGEDYFGCLAVRVRRSSKLMRQIHGWWLGITTSQVA
jgi:transcriptional regulator with XRE-family HTH domain